MALKVGRGVGMSLIGFGQMETVPTRVNRPHDRRSLTYRIPLINEPA